MEKCYHFNHLFSPLGPMVMILSFLQLRWWFGPPVQWFQPKASRKWRWRTVIRTWKMKGWLVGRWSFPFFSGWRMACRCELLVLGSHILGGVFVFSCWHWVLHFCCHILEDYRLEHENTGPLEKDVLIDSKPFWGFKYFEFSPDHFGGWTQFDEHIFQMGWFKPPTLFLLPIRRS